MKKTLLAATLSLSACNSSSFQGSSGQTPATEKPVAPGAADAKPNAQVDASGDGVYVETFAFGETRGALDLVWVVDNSGSMGDKTAKVRKNFDAFMNAVGSKTDLRVILMSLPSSGAGGAIGGIAGFPGLGDLGITLSEEAKGKGHVQIALNVGSYNPLAMAAAASCPAEQTASVDGGASPTGGLKICGKVFTPTPAPGGLGGITPVSDTEPDMTTLMRGAFEDPATIIAAAGVFLPHFRDGAQRAYVFVTDENSFVFEGADFAAAAAAANPGGSPKIFAFRGAKATIDFSNGEGATGAQPACQVAFAGSSYDKAQAAMGGQMFDICADDWSPNFDTLSTSVSQLARTHFELKTKGIKKVGGVEVDGKKLPASAYELDGQTLTIDAASVPAGASTVKITVAT